jgi:hypothetical protein
MNPIMERRICWWIPRLQLGERGAASWQDGGKSARRRQVRAGGIEREQGHRLTGNVSPRQPAKAAESRVNQACRFSN